MNFVAKALIPLLCASLIAQASYADERGEHERSTARVMTRNLYIGGDLTPIFAAQTVPELLAGGALVYTQMVLSDVPARIRAIAHEIVSVRSELVGLQEVATWSTRPILDPLGATEIQYDFLALLLSSLREFGACYQAVSQQPGLDIEFPSDLGIDIRLQIKDVIIAQCEVCTSNPQGRNYLVSLTLPTVAGPFLVPRQWVSIDAELHGKKYRFASTQLEEFNAGVKIAQANQLIGPSGPGNTHLPIILVGDFNSAPVSSGGARDDAAQLVINSGYSDVWVAANGHKTGPTYAQDADLRNPISTATVRIDLILERRFGRHPEAFQVGNIPLDLPGGVHWASDHFGVAACLWLF
jgi:hypothetical protein